MTKISAYPAHPAGAVNPLTLVDVSRYVSPGVFESNSLPFSQLLTQFVTGDNVLFVAATNGDDATGTKGYASLPYETITAAIAAASSGDKILAFGDFDERIILKDGVDIQVFGDLVYTDNSNGTGVIDDNGVAVTCNIIINGVLQNNNTNAFGGRAIKLTGGSTVIFSAQEIISNTTAGGGYAAISLSAAVNVLTVYGKVNGGGIDIAAASVCDIWGDVYIGDAVAVDSGTVISATASKLYIHGNVNSIYGGTNTVSNTATIVIDGDVTTTTGSAPCVSTGGTGSAIIKGKITHQGTGVGLNCEAVISPTRVDAFGGVEAAGDSAVYIESLSDNVNLYGRVECKYNNAAGHAVELNGGTNKVILHSCVLICAHASANRIDGAATDIAVSNTPSVTNTQIDTDIIQQVNSINEDSNAI